MIVMTAVAIAGVHSMFVGLNSFTRFLDLITHMGTITALLAFHCADGAAMLFANTFATAKAAMSISLGLLLPVPKAVCASHYFSTEEVFHFAPMGGTYTMANAVQPVTGRLLL
jgi:hypothetical protein